MDQDGADHDSDLRKQTRYGKRNARKPTLCEAKFINSVKRLPVRNLCYCHVKIWDDFPTMMN
jgi:hypothetical protein